MRSIIVLLLFILFFVLFLPVLLILMLISKTNQKAARDAAFSIVQKFIKLELLVSGTRLHAEGVENIPDEPVLFVGNHRSYYDVLCCISCMKHNTAFVGKKEIKRIPVMAQWMELMGGVFIDRHNIKEGLKAILEAIEVVKGGTSVFIFPEGTRNRAENKDVLAEFKEGSLKIAQKAGCMIVPVAIKNTEYCYEMHKPFVKAADVRVSFLKPFYVSDIPEEQRKKPAEYTRQLIEEDLKRPM